MAREFRLALTELGEQLLAELTAMLGCSEEEALLSSLLVTRECVKHVEAGGQVILRKFGETDVLLAVDQAYRGRGSGKATADLAVTREFQMPLSDLAEEILAELSALLGSTETEALRSSLPIALECVKRVDRRGHVMLLKPGEIDVWLAVDQVFRGRAPGTPLKS